MRVYGSTRCPRWGTDVFPTTRLRTGGVRRPTHSLLASGVTPIRSTARIFHGASRIRLAGSRARGGVEELPAAAACTALSLALVLASYHPLLHHFSCARSMPRCAGPVNQSHSIFTPEGSPYAARPLVPLFSLFYRPSTRSR